MKRAVEIGMDSASAKVTAEVAVEKAIRDPNYRSLSKPLRNAVESKIELQEDPK